MFTKIKKIVLGITVIIFIYSLLVINKKEDKLILLLGDNNGVKMYLEDYLQDYKINDSLTLNSMKSKELLEYVINDVFVPFENKKETIYSLVKRSEFVVISIGLNDLLSKITLDKYEKKIIFDLDSIELMLNVLEKNLSNIIEKIVLVNKNAKIIVSGYDNPFLGLKDEEFNKIFGKLNSLMNSKVSKFNAYFIENKFEKLSCYDSEFSIYLNEDGKRKIAENIYQKIIAITT